MRSCLASITAMYEMHAVISRALRLEFDDVPERMVELDAPGGFSAQVFAGVPVTES